MNSLLSDLSKTFQVFWFLIRPFNLFRNVDFYDAVKIVQRMLHCRPTQDFNLLGCVPWWIQGEIHNYISNGVQARDHHFMKFWGNIFSNISWSILWICKSVLLPAFFIQEILKQKISRRALLCRNQCSKSYPMD